MIQCAHETYTCCRNRDRAPHCTTIDRARVPFWRHRRRGAPLLLQCDYLCRRWSTTRRKFHLDHRNQDIPKWTTDARRTKNARIGRPTVLLHILHRPHYHLGRYRNDHGRHEQVTKLRCAILYCITETEVAVLVAAGDTMNNLPIVARR